MPSSTVKRERLVGPVQMALIAVLFAVSFYFLIPKKDAFVISEKNERDTQSSVIGELDLAYLRARAAVGKPSSEETSRAVSALIRTGQIDSARDLLEEQPDVSLGERERYSLDLELASVDYFAANTAKQKESSRLQLLTRIELLLSRPQLRTTAVLTRTAELSAQLGKPATAAHLYSLLAEQDADNASQWYLKCAQNSALTSLNARSASCFDNAIAAASSANTVFDLRIAQLSSLAASGDRRKTDVVLKQLIDHKPLRSVQREQIAKALLANNRPDEAYKVYATLARTDSAQQVTWLQEAAKWAQASNNVPQAADYLREAASISNGAEQQKINAEYEKLLIAAGNNEEAFKVLSQRIASAPTDQKLLRTGVTLARSLGKTADAAKWNSQLVMSNPTDIEAVNTQISLALANRDLSDAAKWSGLAVGIAPDSLSVRAQYAQIAEWNGNPVAAQKQWEWIAKNHPEKEHYEQVIRLAELNRQNDVALPALVQLVRQSPQNDELIDKLVDLYEAQGQPMLAAQLLKQLQSDHGVRAETQRKLSKLYQHHVYFQESLEAWNDFATSFGRGTDETLHRMEMLWRLRKPGQAADVAGYLAGTGNVSEASNYQVRIIAEIAWRYRMPELAQLVKPHLGDIEDQYAAMLTGKRFVQSLEDEGKNEQAILEATRLWQNTQSNEVAFSAMSLAIRTGNAKSAAAFLVRDENTTDLQKNPEYWVLAASLHLKNDDKQAALAAYDQALKLDNNNVGALSGLLWSHINDQNLTAIAKVIETHQSTAQTEPDLWSPMAIAYLQLGLPELSLTWFDRQLDRIEADYNMLLTFADALEYSGRAEPAHKVRLYAIKRLRPVLAESATQDQSELLRQYAQLINRYGSAEDKEQLALKMLKDASAKQASNEFWREDIAISWLMATQRHEHARLVMSKLHDERLKAPAWQALSVAMAANDLVQIQQVLNGIGKVSVGNHILALRQLGYDQEAYTLAKNSANQAPTLGDRNVARSQYTAMRSERPSFTAAKVKQTSISGLGISESGFTIRHSFDSMNLGFSIDFTQRNFESDRYNLNGNREQSDIALTLYHGDRQFGGSVSAGYLINENDDLTYAGTRHHLSDLSGKRKLTAELAYNEASTASVPLRIAARQHRATIGYEQSLGFREYVKFTANAQDINSRVQQNRIARGLEGRVEVGMRGAIGSNVWSTSIAGTRSQNEIENTLPAELALVPGTSASNILSEKTTSVNLGASLSRGGTQGNYPQTSSPRYYVNANIGHQWPSSTTGLQLDGGAGIRVLGGDELSIGFSLDTQPNSLSDSRDDTTSMGVNYRYHF